MEEETKKVETPTINFDFADKETLKLFDAKARRNGLSRASQIRFLMMRFVNSADAI